MEIAEVVKVMMEQIKETVKSETVVGTPMVCGAFVTVRPNSLLTPLSPVAAVAVSANGP